MKCKIVRSDVDIDLD